MKLMYRILLSLAFLVVLIQTNYAQNLTISGGFSYSLIVCSSGRVFAWGSNTGGQLRHVRTGAEGLLPPFSPRPTGNYSTPQIIAGLPEIFQVDAGSGGHAMGLTCDGQVITWGANCFGQLGGGSALPGTGSSGSNGCPSNSPAPVTVVGVGGVGVLSDISYVSASTSSAKY